MKLFEKVRFCGCRVRQKPTHFWFKKLKFGKEVFYVWSSQERSKDEFSSFEENVFRDGSMDSSCECSQLSDERWFSFMKEWGSR